MTLVSGDLPGMASSALAIIRENTRRAVTGDLRFYRKLVYFFELRVPASLGAQGTSFMFPLALNPQELTMEEPFTLEAQPTEGGGLYVEENGIVQRTLRIRGTTGFKPRKLDATKGIGLIPYPGKRSFGRDIVPFILDELSGQMHFQWLQDKVFRAYADLKRDPSTSFDTKLIFHNQKDSEHWLVAPQAFVMTRKRTTYEYNIELLVLGAAESEYLTLSEDRSTFDRIRDVLRRINDAVGLLTGAVRDVTAAVNEIRRIAAAVDTILASVGTVINACTDFVNGVTSLINTPLAFVQTTIALIEDTNAFFQEVEELEGAAQSLPDNIRNSFRQLQDNLEVVASYPGSFQKPVEVAIDEAIKRQQLSTSVSESELSTLSSSSPTSLEDYRALGTGLMPGDADRAAVDDRTGAAPPRYSSARQIQIQQGDTLSGLASRYLGDARLWKNIAILNGLQPPFVTDLEIRDLVQGAAFPGTLGRGQTILVPSTSPSPTAQATFATYGVRVEEANDVHLLGRDFLLQSTDGGKTFDIPIDVEGGSVDGKTVAGVNNLTQAIQTRLTTEQGHDILYRYLGVKRVVGLGNRVTDVEAAQFRVVESVTTDPRIAGVRRIEFVTGGPDALVVDMTVEVRGFAETAQIKVEVA